METLQNAVPGSAFASLPETPIRWSTFALGFLVPTALVVFFATTSISFMAPVLDPVDTRDSVHLVAPVLEPVPEEPKPVAEIKAPAPAPKADRGSQGTGKSSRDSAATNRSTEGRSGQSNASFGDCGEARSHAGVRV